MESTQPEYSLIRDLSFGYFLWKEGTSLLLNPNLVQETWNSKRYYLSPILQRILVQKLRRKVVSYLHIVIFV